MPPITSPPNSRNSTEPEDPLSYYAPKPLPRRRAPEPKPEMSNLDQMYAYFDADRDGPHR